MWGRSLPRVECGIDGVVMSGGPTPLPFPCCFKLTERMVHYCNVLCLKTSKVRTCLEH